MNRGLFLLLSLLNATLGCSSLRMSASVNSSAFLPLPERCIQLDDRHSMYTMIGAGSALLAGGTGLSTLASDNPTAKLTLALSSLAFGAIAAGMQAGAHKSAERFLSEGCGRE